MRKSRTADFGACAICRLVSMRSIFSGATRSSGPSLAVSFPASSAPVSDEVAGGEPAARDRGAGDGLARGIDCAIALGLQHDVERHRQPRRRRIRGLGHGRAGQPVEQPDLAAMAFVEIGAIHAVDDAGQHEARIRRIEQCAVEQLEVKRRSDADGFVRQIRLVAGDVALEFVVERLADRQPSTAGRTIARWSAAYRPIASAS